MGTKRTKGQMLALVLGIMSGITGLLLLLFTVQNYFGASGSQTDAANTFFLVNGLPSIILIIVSILLIRFARRKQPG